MPGFHYLSVPNAERSPPRQARGWAIAQPPGTRRASPLLCPCGKAASPGDLDVKVLQDALRKDGVDLSRGGQEQEIRA